eukprot:scpid7388/ scgid33116/ Disco-interacting protein 2 homolog B
MSSGLPPSVLKQLSDLDLELAEGDITQKGYDKKKQKLLAPYQAAAAVHASPVSDTNEGQKHGSVASARSSNSSAASVGAAGVDSSAAAARATQESPYRIDMTQSRAAAERAAAVRQALAKFQESQEPVMPMASKRASMSVSGSSAATSSASTAAVSASGVAAGQSSASRAAAAAAASVGLQRALGPSSASPSPSQESPPPVQQQQQFMHRTTPTAGQQVLPQQVPTTNAAGPGKAATPQSLAGRQHQPSVRPGASAARAGDSGGNSAASVAAAGSAAAQSAPMYTASNAPAPGPVDLGDTKVSAKIQQLLNTLRRPKKNRKPIEQYFADDQKEDAPADPNAPKPAGPMMSPFSSEPLQVDSSMPRNLEAAIQRYASKNNGKLPAISQVEPNGKIAQVLSYGKLSSRSLKLSFTLLNKLSNLKGVDSNLKPGDRVAIIIGHNEPAAFSVAFFGCLTACVVPVAIEPPSSRDDPGGQQIGFLLGSLGVTVAITTDSTLRGLPKDEGSHHIVQFKGWPRLTWLPLDSVSKPPKDWNPPSRSPPDAPAYVEYTVDRDGAVMGVSVERQGLLAHCRALLQSMQYREGEVIVSAVECHRQAGFWNAILAATYAGMHTICIPANQAKSNPLHWLHTISKTKAAFTLASSAVLGAASSRLLKELQNTNLESLHALIISDGTSPWCLGAADSFQQAFSSRGFQPDMFCPCACSSETMTLSLRRPGLGSRAATGRGIMSISGMSYGVVRVEEQISLSSVTLQDLGVVLPGCRVAVVHHRGAPVLCKTDQVGEICVSGVSSGTQYWGLSGKSNHVFRVQPVNDAGQLVGSEMYVRSGLLGFIGPGGLVFVCGTIIGLMELSGRRHNADDIMSTVLAVEPQQVVHRQRIAVFSMSVYREERIVVVAEQHPLCTEEDAFQWMTNVLPAVESIHASHLYGLALVPAGALPKHSDGGVHVTEARQRFIDGSLNPTSLLMCPHAAVLNIPEPRKAAAGNAAAGVMGDAITGNRMAVAVGKQLEPMGDERDAAGRYQYLSEVLRWRAQSSPDHILYTTVNERGQASKTLNCSQLLKRAERVGAYIADKANLSSGDHVVLLYPAGFDLIIAFYACLLYGFIPVVVRPPTSSTGVSNLPTIRMIVEVSKAVAVLTNHPIHRFMRSREATAIVDPKAMPPILETDDVSRKKVQAAYRPPTAEMLAYLDFSVSTTGVLAGIKMSHSSATNLCRSLKLSCELYPGRTLGLCLDPYTGLGLVLWCMTGVYSGHHAVIISPTDLETNPSLWLQAISQHKIRDTFCSYSVIDTCMKELGTAPVLEQLRDKQGVDLSSLRNCVVVAEERPRAALTTAFCTLFQLLGLSPRSVSTSFGSRVNVGVCTQGASQPDPGSAYVDVRAMRTDRVALLERGSPNSLSLLECGKILPGVRVVVVNPETRAPCLQNEIGELWVSSSHNASGYFGLPSDVNDQLTTEHFRAKLSAGGSASETFARSGFLGFIRHHEGSNRSSSTNLGEVGFDSLFLVGALDEALSIRGYRYHPIDLEATAVRCHKSIGECAVFTWTKLLVVVVELSAPETEALNVVPVVTSAVLEDHQVVVGIVVVVDPGSIPMNTRGEKQRMHLRDRFLADELDPIYVAYNM